MGYLLFFFSSVRNKTKNLSAPKVDQSKVNNLSSESAFFPSAAEALSTVLHHLFGICRQAEVNPGCHLLHQFAPHTTIYKHVKLGTKDLLNSVTSLIQILPGL